MAGASPTAVGSVVPIWTISGVPGPVGPAGPVGPQGATGPQGPAAYPGFALDQKRTYINGALAGAGGTFDLPGPAAGFVRFYESCGFGSNTLAAGVTLTSVVMNPGALPISAAAIGATTAFFSVILPPLQNGESIRFTNGGVNAGYVDAAFYDLAIGGMLFTRIALGAADVTLIPAPAAGTRSRLVTWGRAPTIDGPAVQTAYNSYNPDTVAHSIETRIGGVLVGRGAPAAGGSGSIVPALPALALFDAIVEARLTEAVVTTAPNAWIVYETGIAP